MALLFMDGFDHYGTGSGAIPFVQKKWDASSGISGTGIVSGRTGNAVALYGFDSLIKSVTPPGDVFIIGFALRFASFSIPDFVQFMEGTTNHIGVGINASGFLTVDRSGTLLATATSLPLTVGSWSYVEVKVVIHDTAGSVIVHVDGTPVTFNTSLTGIDTRNGATGNVDRIILIGTSSSPQGQFDDLYICDDAGTTNNDFLGVCVVESLLPATGNGSLTDFTTSAGTDHGALVRENPPDDDTTYVTSQTVGQQDCYHYPALALAGAILGVQTDLYAKKTDAGARTVAGLLRVGSTNYPGAAVAPPTTYHYLPEIRETNPATGIAWTSADVNALQVGMKIVS